MIIMKLQSAMEYLTTYGWAILIIAIVTGVIFELNLFNPNTYASKAEPGACSVVRTPTGVTSLSGTCVNLEPMYVAQFSGSSSYISTGMTGLPLGNSPRSDFEWVYLRSSPGASWYFIQDYGSAVTNAASGIGVESAATTMAFDGWNVDVFGASLPLNSWHFIGYTYNGATATVYIDGNPSGTATISPLSTTGSVAYIGTCVAGNIYFFPGSIANVQIYNASLSANSVQALYMEGIGGEPINLRNLVGWWPLNDDANDYSGNGNNGVATSVFYTVSWTNGYTQP